MRLSLTHFSQRESLCVCTAVSFSYRTTSNRKATCFLLCGIQPLFVQSLLRFLGMTLMLIGAALSVFGYMIPRLHTSTRGSSRISSQL